MKLIKVLLTAIIFLEFTILKAQDLGIAKDNLSVIYLTGDLNYSIQLLEIPNGKNTFPVSAVYQAGITMEQEASWIGLGWNLYPGAITRSVQGAPDDYKHKKITTTTSPESYVTSKTRTKSITYYGSLYFDDAMDAPNLLSETWGEINKYYSLDSYTNPYDHISYSSEMTNEITNCLSFVAYDNYFVSGPGIMGSMNPRLFELGTIFRAGYYDETSGFDEYDFYKLNDFTKSYSDIHFYFNSDQSGYLEYMPGSFSLTEGTNDILWETQYNDSYLEIDHDTDFSDHDIFYNSTTQRKGSSKYVQWYTNNDMHTNQSVLGEKGIMEYEPVLGQRNVNDWTDFDPDGIGGYSITDENGKTYHYALPEYVQIEYISTKGYSNRIKGYIKSGKHSKYAVRWLLTGITGPDFIDRGQIGIINEQDDGYWVKFDYGKWSDGFPVRNPFTGYLPDLETNMKHYSFAFRQIYYLDAIKTKTHTAYFIKDLRLDAVSSTDFENILIKLENYDTEYGYCDQEDYLDFDVSTQNQLLKLDRIILVKNQFSDLDKNSTTSLINQATNIINKRIERQCYQVTIEEDYYGERYTVTTALDPETLYVDFLELNTHVCNSVYDINDLIDNDIEVNALGVIRFTTNYTLCHETPGSQAAGNGKLTLGRIAFEGQNETLKHPDFNFEYYNQQAYDIDKMDNWGFYGGRYIGPALTNKDLIEKNDAHTWSLKKIIHPLGKETTIDYESDTYDTEAALNLHYISIPVNIFWESNQYLRITIINDADVAYLRDNNIQIGDDFNISGHYGIKPDSDCNLEPGSFDNTFNIFSIEDDYDYKVYRVSNAIQFLDDNCYHTNIKFGECIIKYDLEEFDHFNGGGIRVSQITYTIPDQQIQDEILSFKTVYEYEDGITSYAPNGKKRYIPYIYELPAPNVMYKNTIVKTLNNEEEQTSKTIYEFNTIEPTNNYISENYNLNNQLWISNPPNEKPITDDDKPKVHYRSSTIHDFKSSIGRPVSEKFYNEFDEKIKEIIYEYYNHDEIKGGKVRETFYDCKRQLNQQRDHMYFTSTSKVVYPNILKKITTKTASGEAITKLGNTELLNNGYNIYTGKAIKTINYKSDGAIVASEAVPAFLFDDEYASLGPKVLNEDNFNLINVNAVNYSYLLNNDLSEAGVLAVTAEKYSQNWSYRELSGVEYRYNDAEPTEAVWRLKSSHSWDGAIDQLTGIYQGFTKPTSNDQISEANGWITDNEITHYTWESSTSESFDITGDYKATKFYNDEKVLTLAGNCKFQEFTFTSFEDFSSRGTFVKFEGEVFAVPSTNQVIDGRSVTYDCAAEISDYTENVKGLVSGYCFIKPHSGRYLVQMTGNQGPFFDITYQSGSICPFENDKIYRAQIWIHEQSPEDIQLNISFYDLNACSSRSSENTVQINEWILITTDLFIPTDYTFTQNMNMRIEVIDPTPDGTAVYLDDFRVVPVGTNMNSYIYDSKTGYLTTKLNELHFATYYKYNDAGRNIEVIEESQSGRKTVERKQYHYAAPTGVCGDIILEQPVIVGKPLIAKMKIYNNDDQTNTYELTFSLLKQGEQNVEEQTVSGTIPPGEHRFFTAELEIPQECAYVGENLLQISGYCNVDFTFNVEPSGAYLVEYLYPNWSIQGDKLNFSSNSKPKLNIRNHGCTSTTKTVSSSLRKGYIDDGYQKWETIDSYGPVTKSISTYGDGTDYYFTLKHYTISIGTANAFKLKMGSSEEILCISPTPVNKITNYPIGSSDGEFKVEVLCTSSTVTYTATKENSSWNQTFSGSDWVEFTGLSDGKYYVNASFSESGQSYNFNMVIIMTSI